MLPARHSLHTCPPRRTLPPLFGRDRPAANQAPFRHRVIPCPPPSCRHIPTVDQRPARHLPTDQRPPTCRLSTTCAPLALPLPTTYPSPNRHTLTTCSPPGCLPLCAEERTMKNPSTKETKSRSPVHSPEQAQHTKLSVKARHNDNKAPEQASEHTQKHSRLAALRRSTMTDNEIFVSAILRRPPRALLVGVDASGHPFWPPLAPHDWPLSQGRRRQRMPLMVEPE